MGSGHNVRMDLPVMPPVAPMLAKAVKGVPLPNEKTGELLYEPKWDSFLHCTCQSHESRPQITVGGCTRTP